MALAQLGMTTSTHTSPPPPSYGASRPRGRSRQFSRAAAIATPAHDGDGDGVAIELDRPGRTFSAGDVVSGVVVVPNEGGGSVGRVTVMFAGAAEAVMYQKRGTAKSRATLFTLVQVLRQQGEGVEEDTVAQPRRWAFAFTVPAAPQELAEHRQWAQSALFATAADQGLPPSFSDDCVAMLTGFECRVAYKLTATLARQGKDGVEDVRGQHEVSVQCAKAAPPTTLPQDVRTATRACAVQSTLLQQQPELAGRRRPSLMARSRSLLAGSAASAHFVVEVDVPQHLHVGERLAVRVRVQHDAARSSCGSAPAVQLERFALRVVMTTATRGPQEGLLASGAALTRERVVYERVRQDAGGFRAGAAASSVTVSTEPLITRQASFRTFNVSRAYRCEVEVRVRCADGSFGVAAGGLLKLDPAALDAPAERTARRHEGGAEGEAEGEELPVYRADSAALDPQSELLFDEPPATVRSGQVVGGRPTFNAFAMGPIGMATPIAGAGWR